MKRITVVRKPESIPFTARNRDLSHAGHSINITLGIPAEHPFQLSFFLLDFPNLYIFAIYPFSVLLQIRSDEFDAETHHESIVYVSHDGNYIRDKVKWIQEI